MRLKHLEKLLLINGLRLSRNFGTRGSEVRILSPHLSEISKILKPLIDLALAHQGVFRLSIMVDTILGVMDSNLR
jgi:hypothetical protein